MSVFFLIMLFLVPVWFIHRYFDLRVLSKEERHEKARTKTLEDDFAKIKEGIKQVSFKDTLEQYVDAMHQLQGNDAWKRDFEKQVMRTQTRGNVPLSQGNVTDRKSFSAMCREYIKNFSCLKHLKKKDKKG